MKTDELIRELRLYAEQHRDNSAFLLGLIYQAADRLEEQAQIIAQYQKADTFLAAHGWKWEEK